MDRFYPQLGLPLTARARTVIKAAAKAMHPWLRRQRSLRLSRRRFYRDMLNSHDAAREAAGLTRPEIGTGPTQSPPNSAWSNDRVFSFPETKHG